MEMLGRFEIDPQGSGVDAGDIYSICLAPLRAYAESNPEGFMNDLRITLLPKGGRAVYGGACCIVELLGYSLQDPNYLALLDAAIDVKREMGLSSGHLKGYEWSRWLETHGPDSW